MNIRIISALPVIKEVAPQHVYADSDDGAAHVWDVYDHDGPIPGKWMAAFRKMAAREFARMGAK